MSRRRIYEGTLQERKNAASKAWYYRNKHHFSVDTGMPNLTEDIKAYNHNYYITVTKPRREAERLRRKAKDNGDN